MNDTMSVASSRAVRTSMLRRIVRFATVAVVLSIVGIGCTAATGFAAGLDELRVSYSPMPLNAPSIVSAKLDLVDKAFKDQGIDVKYSTFLSGPEMTEAFAGKSLDIASVMGATSVLAARAAGLDVRIIAAYSTCPSGFAICVPADSDIRTVADLKGHKVAGPKGTAVHQLLAKALQKAKLSVKDVEFLNMLVPDTAAALVAKQVDAGLLVEPTLTKLVDAGKVRVLQDGTGLIGGLTVIVARGDLVRENRAILTRFLNAHQAAVKFTETHRAETIDAVADETKLSKEQVKRLLAKYDFDPSLRPAVLNELRECADFMLDAGMIKKPVDVDDLVVGGLL